MAVGLAYFLGIRVFANFPLPTTVGKLVVKAQWVVLAVARTAALATAIRLLALGYAPLRPLL